MSKLCISICLPPLPPELITHCSVWAVKWMDPLSEKRVYIWTMTVCSPVFRLVNWGRYGVVWCHTVSPSVTGCIEVAVASIWTGGWDVSEDVFIMRAFVVVSVCIWASTVFGTSGRQRVHPVLHSSRWSYRQENNNASFFKNNELPRQR